MQPTVALCNIEIRMENTLTISKSIGLRHKEIFNDFLVELDKHLADIDAGTAPKMYHIKDFADILNIHPTHLSNTIKELTGKPPCDFFEEKILVLAKTKLLETNLPIGQIANDLTYDPSNFTKFFKHFEGMTPKQFRNLHKN